MADSSGYWQRLASARGGRRRMLRAGAVAVSGLGAAWLAACGGGDSNKDSGSSSSPGAARGQAATAAPGVQPTSAALQDRGEAKPGGTLTWRDVGEAPLDPTNNPTYRAQVMAGHVYSRLLKFNTGPKVETAYNYEILPDLAAKHEVTSDGLQYTFKLNEQAKFHNKPPVGGRRVTSEDIKFSFDRFRSAPKNTNKAAFGSEQNQIVTAVETPDPSTVVFKLAKPYAPFLNLVANPQYLWIQPKEIDGGFNPDKEMIGSGPWVLDRVEPSVQVTFRKNPEYFVKGRPHLDGVTKVIVPDTAQATAQFQAGRLSFYAVPAAQKEDVLKTNPKSQLITYIPTTYTFIAPQQRGNSPFRDVRVRKALSMAVDRKSWLDLIYYGQGSAYLSAVPASMGRWWLNPQGPDAGPGGANFKFDPKASRDLLKAAGMENMPLRYIYTNNAYGDIFNQGAEATAQFLKEAGFNPQIVAQDYLREYIDAKGTFFGTYEGVFYGLQTPFTDPHDYLFNMNHPRSTRNHAGIDDARLSQMIDDQLQTIKEEDRVKKVLDIQRYYLEQMFYIPIAVGYAYQFQQPEMRRLYYSATYGYPTESFAEAWIDKA